MAGQNYLMSRFWKLLSGQLFYQHFAEYGKQRHKFQKADVERQGASALPDQKMERFTTVKIKQICSRTKGEFIKY